MTEQVNTPELRFPEFNEEWREFNLKDISTKKSKKNKNKLYNETFTNSAEYGIVSQKDYFYKEISNVRNLSNYYIVDPDDFVYNPRISRLAPVGPINRNKLNRIGVMSPLYTVFSTKLPIKSFLEYYFKTTKWHKFMKLNGDSGARSDRFTIKQSLFVKMPIVLPSEQEQEKIGYFFSKLDQQIELEEKKLELLEQQKRGYMQKIFSQELRFQNENRSDYPNWKKITIKEVANLTAGKGKKNENKGKYIIMDMGTVTKNGTMLTHKSTPYESDLLNKGDLVMPKDDIGGGHIIGKTVFIPESHKYVLGDHVYRLEIKNCNSLFLHYYINSDIVNHSLKRKVTGSAQLGLNRKSVEEEVIKTPCLEEQGKIGNLFNKIDNLIELQIDKIELLKQRKQGLLQKMFV